MRLAERLLACAQNTPGLKKCVPKVRPENRTVFVGRQVGDFSGLDVIVPEKYCDNMLTTAKYTPWNFIFKNLYEQFLRIANFYFLVVAFIMFSIPNTPVSPLTSALPLGFVLLTTAIKQAYEDWLRRKEDNVVNNRSCEVVQHGKIVTVPSYQIQVGDIVRVSDNEQFPCDLVLLASSDNQGQCTIQTANLDGETNLKTFVSLSDTRSMDTPEKLSDLRGVIDCQQPITDLYRFVGKMTIYNETLPHVTTKSLQAQNVLLRGAKLKNTDYVYGCAIYTGHDTKLALNSVVKSGKRSCIEKRLNTYLIVYVLWIFVQCGISTILRHVSLYNVWKEPDDSRSQWYIPFLFDYNNEEGTATSRQGFIDFLYFYVIYNYVIPISLYVTIELQKFVGSIFFGFDADMYDERIDERAKANTSDLNEELGQVEYLFCDKTGTLTENDMQFRQCSINGRLYIEDHGTFGPNTILEAKLAAEKEAEKVARRNSYRNRRRSTSLRLTASVVQREALNRSVDAVDVVDGDDTVKFFEVLSLCHTVRIESSTPTANGNGSLHTNSSKHNTESSGSSDVVDSPPVSALPADLSGKGYEYNASSPDEKALVEASRMFGIVYHGSIDNKLHVTFHGNRRSYILHQVLEFDSDRKCMTVMIENDKGEYQVLCKGAESSVLQKCIHGPIDVTIEHVDYYASLGLRTLVIASKTVDAVEFDRLITCIETAKQDLGNRDEALVSAYDLVEQGFTVIGATAVEDKLQDGVKETIENLRAAGIKVWVLTGDKEETAVNISYSAGHFDNSMEILCLTGITSEADAYSCLLTLKDSIKAAQLDGRNVALVVDGASLAMTLNRYAKEFSDVCMACSTVLCCRMTPIQKAEVVKVVKNSPSKPKTAAVGDGANDVSMIQEAHVGIGIMGKEGRQAARSSDYAFGRFKFLLKTFLVHGHFYYVRLAILVQYFFFKNVAFITANFYFIFFSAYSALSVFDTIFLTFYNVTFTSLPIYLYGLFEQHVPPHVLMEDPRLYKKIRQNRLMDSGNFFYYTAMGLWYSLVVSFGIYLTYVAHTEFGRNGLRTDITAYGTAVIFICTTAVNIKLMLSTYYWTWITLIGYLITLICNWAMVAIYSKWATFFSPTNTSMSGVLGTLFSSGVFWLTALLLLVLCLLPDFVRRAYIDMTDPVYILIKHERLISTPKSTSKHVMFVNSDDSISMKDMKRRTDRDEFSDNTSKSGIAAISHRYITDEPGSSYCGAGGGAGGGGGYINSALTTDE